MSKEIWTADAETDPFKFGRVPKAFLFGCYDGLEYHYFWGPHCADQFAHFIKDKKVEIYLHNGGKFDIFYLLKHITIGSRLKIINGRIAQCKIGKATLRDSYLILPVSLAKMEKDSIDYRKFEKDKREQYKDEIIEYWKTDCRSLYDHVTHFKNNYGSKLTLAGTAMDYWHKMEKIQFKRERVFAKYQTAERFFDKFTPFYYGGRCEAFEKGVFKGDFKYYDINSAYPFLMASEKHPFSMVHETLYKLDKSKLKSSFVSFTGTSKGALPFRDKFGGLSFPNDDIVRQYSVTGWEILTGLRTKTIQIHDFIVQFNFTRCYDFKAYVDHFYKLKAEAKKTGDDKNYLLAKLFMNALYGRYALNGRKFKDYCILNDDDVKQFKEEQLDKGFHWMQGEYLTTETRLMDKPSGNLSFCNLATAASITGGVRAYLFENILKCKRPLYCDTDSIICESGNLNIGSKLGEWEIEAENIHKVAIAGKKMYSAFRAGHSPKIACKGARLTGEQIERVAQGETIEYAFESPNYSIKNGIMNATGNKDKFFTKRRIKLT